jgi:hypothetical protein
MKALIHHRWSRTGLSGAPDDGYENDGQSKEVILR